MCTYNDPLRRPSDHDSCRRIATIIESCNALPISKVQPCGRRMGAEVTCNRASIPRTWGLVSRRISVSDPKLLKACSRMAMTLLGRVRAAVVLTAYWAAVCHAVPAEQPRAAICFFGLTRSLAYTIESIRSSIFDQLISNGINYSVFVHTYSVTLVCRAASRQCLFY